MLVVIILFFHFPLSLYNPYTTYDRIQELPEQLIRGFPKLGILYPNRGESNGNEHGKRTGNWELGFRG